MVFLCQKNHQLISKMCHILAFSEQSTVGINWIWFLNKFIRRTMVWCPFLFAKERKPIFKKSKNWVYGQLSTFFCDFCVSWESLRVRWHSKECWTCFGESVGGYKRRSDEQKLLWPWGRIKNEESASCYQTSSSWTALSGWGPSMIGYSVISDIILGGTPTLVIFLFIDL